MKRTLLDQHTLSGISRDIAQVAFAAILIEPIMQGQFKAFLIIFGSVFVCVAWGYSLFLTRQQSYERA